VVFVDFLLYYADPKFIAEIDTTKIQPAPTHYIGKDGDERIVDLVFMCPLKSGNGSLMAVIVFEHESRSLKKVPHKLLKHISAIWDAEMKEGKPLSAPYFIVLRTTKRPHRGKYPTMSDLLPKDKDGKPLGHVLEIRYDVVDLPAWDFGKLVGGTVLRLVLGMLLKMTGGNLDEFPVVLRLLAEITDEEQQFELTKELWDFVDRAFAARNRKVDVATWNKALHPIYKGREKAMIKTIFEEREAIGEARGKAIGEARGRAIGEARGRAEGKTEMVLKILQARFHRVPKDVEKTIRHMTDSIALDSWAIHAATCQSMDEFAEAVK